MAMFLKGDGHILFFGCCISKCRGFVTSCSWESNMLSHLYLLFFFVLSTRNMTFETKSEYFALCVL